MLQDACMSDFIKCGVGCYDEFISVNRNKLDFSKMVVSLTLGLILIC